MGHKLTFVHDHFQLSLESGIKERCSVTVVLMIFQKSNVMERGLVQRPILLSIETIFVVDRTDRDQTAIHHCAGILFGKRNRFSIFLIPEISELEADVLFPPTGASSSSASVRCFQELVCVKKLQRRPQLIQRSLNSPLLILTKIWVLTSGICQNNRAFIIHSGCL